jgi:hypothetical protein
MKNYSLGDVLRRTKILLLFCGGGFAAATNNRELAERIARNEALPTLSAL